MYNVYIRPLQIEDAAISYLWRNDEEIWKYTGSRPNLEITYDIERDWIVKVITEKISKRFAIIVDGVYVGNIQLTNLTKQDAQYHIFIGDKNYWGKGIAQLATFQILTYARETLQLNEVYLQVNVDNAAAVRVYEKSGFEKEQVVEQNLKMVCFLESLQQPTVSIFCMVYNHEKYIVECLDSLLMQICTFNYDIVLGEDCSKDNSRSIILNFNERFPGKFKLLLHDQNVGAQKNQEQIFKSCTGKYISICEGDDYWTDPLKLQKQVDFLEANPTYGLVCTNYTSDEIITPFDTSKEISLKDILKDSAVGTVTALFKKELIIEYFKEQNNLELSMGDYQLWLFMCSRARVYKLSDNTAYYRILQNSASGRNNALKLKKFALDVLQITKQNLNKISSKQDTDDILRERYGQLFKILIDSRDREFIKYQLSFFKTVNHITVLDLKIFIKGIYKVYL
ncbi:GNAT family N-acetyltransferase [Flavobacterium sp. K77]|uniref:GNAT family N-acetyltransferase n=1 Tax=Flavobacterium sp. K77 TaxID=2910676 RepID=UPI001F1F04BC|nr:GNAT family N-acetyltransferase [Flavobacterium sp. K77]MCF6142091.1 GNAT family N-acetyltransferase [Flavobacterium sp. K77]